MDVVLSTSLAILGEAKAFARSAKQAKKLREKLETESSSTESMLKKLQDLVEKIGHMDDNSSSNAIVSAGPPSGRTIKSFLKLDDIKGELENLQKDAGNVRTQLESKYFVRRKEKIRLKRFWRTLAPSGGAPRRYSK